MNVFFAHAADFSSPMTILALALIGIVILFIYLFNSLSMRRTQLDRQIEDLRMILRRRAELAAELIPELPLLPVTAPVAELLHNEEVAAAKVGSMTDAEPEKMKEYSKLGTMLTEVLEPCRAALEQYNRMVDHPDARRFMRFFRFLPREKF